MDCLGHSQTAVTPTSQESMGFEVWLVYHWDHFMSTNYRPPLHKIKCTPSLYIAVCFQFLAQVIGPWPFVDVCPSVSCQADGIISTACNPLLKGTRWTTFIVTRNEYEYSLQQKINISIHCNKKRICVHVYQAHSVSLTCCICQCNDTTHSNGVKLVQQVMLSSSWNSLVIVTWKKDYIDSEIKWKSSQKD